MPTKFDPHNEASTNDKVFLISSVILLCSMPWWAPTCAPTTSREKADCEFKCEKVDKKQFIEVYPHSNGRCHCGRDLNFKPVEIRRP